MYHSVRYSLTMQLLAGDARQLMEESLQVYQQLSGLKDTNTLKCHVS